MNRLRDPIVQMLVVLTVAGCDPGSLQTDYGKRDFAASVSGTAILAALYEQSGHRVTSWRRLSPKLDSCQTIVWAPDDYDPPSLEAREYLEGWLEDDSNRTLVFIGRDFDPLPGYWSQLLATAPADERTELVRRHARAILHRREQRGTTRANGYARWFVQQGDRPERQVTNLSGPWSAGIDDTKADLRIATRFEIPTLQDLPPPAVTVTTGPTPAQIRSVPRFLRRFLNGPRIERRELPDKFDILLSGDGVPFVTRITDDDWDGGQILVVANGSFLLNMPLVNHEHRKLAQRLVDECDLTGKVVFLESDNRGLRAQERDSESGSPTKMELFRIWPVNVILIHFLALGVIFCAVVIPIFGRPKRLPASSPSDFGWHIDALGELLEKAGDAQLARDRIAYYQQHVRQ